jgi:mono/diheme cytochrome c family protein
MEQMNMTESKGPKLLLDHDYDGIQELDNRLPPWWLYLFYITIAWALGYLVYYHVLDLGYTSSEEYNAEMNPDSVAHVHKARIAFGYRSPFFNPQGDITPLQKVAEQQQIQVLTGQSSQPGNELPGSENNLAAANFDDLILAAMARATPPNLEKLKTAFPDLYRSFQSGTTQITGLQTGTGISPLTDEGSLAGGKQIYITNCITCHGQSGEGGIGPNLTDNYYLHGQGMANTVKTITAGVPAKGMISWRGILNEIQIKQVASYLLTLHGTNPPNPKPPQGEKAGLSHSP